MTSFSSLTPSQTRLLALLGDKESSGVPIPTIHTADMSVLFGLIQLELVEVTGNIEMKQRYRLTQEGRRLRADALKGNA